MFTKACPIHGPYDGICTTCLRDIVIGASTTYAPAYSAYPDGFKLVHYSEPLALELNRQRSEDRYEVQRLLDSIEGVK